MRTPPFANDFAGIPRLRGGEPVARTPIAGYKPRVLASEFERPEPAPQTSGSTSHTIDTTIGAIFNSFISQASISGLNIEDIDPSVFGTISEK